MSERNNGIDIGLAALCEHASPDQTLSVIEIADVCGCNKSRIEQIIKSGLKKLKKTFHNKEDYLND